MSGIKASDGDLLYLGTFSNRRLLYPSLRPSEQFQFRFKPRDHKFLVTGHPEQTVDLLDHFLCIGHTW